MISLPLHSLLGSKCLTDFTPLGLTVIAACPMPPPLFPGLFVPVNILVMLSGWYDKTLIAGSALNRPLLTLLLLGSVCTDFRAKIFCFCKKTTKITPVRTSFHSPKWQKFSRTKCFKINILSLLRDKNRKKKILKSAPLSEHNATRTVEFSAHVQNWNENKHCGPSYLDLIEIIIRDHQLHPFQFSFIYFF